MPMGWLTFLSGYINEIVSLDVEKKGPPIDIALDYRQIIRIKWPVVLDFRWLRPLGNDFHRWPMEKIADKQGQKEGQTKESGDFEQSLCD